MKKHITKLNNIAVKYNLYLFLSIIFAIFILAGSITPEISIGKQGTSIKNSGFSTHFVSYFVLSSTILLFLSSKKIQKPFIKAALLAGSYGLFIELIQFFITYRHFQILDIFTNFIGASLIFVFYLFKR